MNKANPTMAPAKIRWLLAGLLLTGLSACNESLALKVTSEVPMPLISQIPISMGVYYDDNFRNYTYRENTPDRQNWAIESGASQVKLFNQILPSMFRNVVNITAMPVTGENTGVKAVLVPAVEEMQFSLPEETRLDTYEVWIKFKIRLLQPDGTVITEWPLTAYGKTETEFLKNRKQGLNGAMEVALRDAGAKLAIGFPEAVEVKAWLEANVGH